MTSCTGGSSASVCKCRRVGTGFLPEPELEPLPQATVGLRGQAQNKWLISPRSETKGYRIQLQGFTFMGTGRQGEGLTVWNEGSFPMYRSDPVPV